MCTNPGSTLQHLPSKFLKRMRLEISWQDEEVERIKEEVLHNVGARRRCPRPRRRLRHSSSTSSLSSTTSSSSSSSVSSSFTDDDDEYEDENECDDLSFYDLEDELRAGASPRGRTLMEDYVSEQYVKSATERRRRWCSKCNVFKPRYTHHCRICGICVLDMDHHCPWVNNCVGWRNHRPFLQFLFYVLVGCSCEFA